MARSGKLGPTNPRCGGGPSDTLHSRDLDLNVPSTALATWLDAAATELDEIVAAHSALGGTGRGRRRATLQVNYAYTMLLASQFQRFCRDLHSEASDVLCAHVATTADPWAEMLVRQRLTRNRKLDRGNANPGSIGSDFSLLGMGFWDDVRAHHARNQGRQVHLERLNDWRNAIAHQDFLNVPALDATGRKTLRKADVETWRGACSGLATSFDAVVSTFVSGLVGTAPW